MVGKQTRRRFERFPVSIPGKVVLSEQGISFDAEIIDISVGGAFVHCTAPIAIGQEVILQIQFDFPTEIKARVIQGDKKAEPVSIPKERSVVKWVRGSSTSGFGVEFLATTPETRKLLEELVRSSGKIYHN